MSRFMQNVRHLATGNYYQLQPRFEPIKALSAKMKCIDSRPFGERLSEFIFEVTWRMRYSVQDEPLAREMMYRNCFEQLRRDVFGEFIEKVSALERAVYEGEHTKALKIIESIREEVFG